MRPSDAQQKPCPCGGRRQARHIVCPACWKATPASLRDCFRDARDIDGARQAASRIAALAKTRNIQPTLF